MIAIITGCIHLSLIMSSFEKIFKQKILLFKGVSPRDVRSPRGHERAQHRGRGVHPGKVRRRPNSPAKQFLPLRWVSRGTFYFSHKNVFSWSPPNKSSLFSRCSILTKNFFCVIQKCGWPEISKKNPVGCVRTYVVNCSELVSDMQQILIYFTNEVLNSESPNVLIKTSRKKIIPAILLQLFKLLFDYLTMTISLQGFKEIVQISKLNFHFFFIIMLQKYLMSLPLIVIVK